MPNEFDPYREALVVEHITLWPSDRYGLNNQQQECVETALHAHPESATELAYIRLSTGFCRRIQVTSDDVDRILGQSTTVCMRDQAREQEHE